MKSMSITFSLRNLRTSSTTRAFIDQSCILSRVFSSTKSQNLAITLIVLQLSWQMQSIKCTIHKMFG